MTFWTSYFESDRVYGLQMVYLWVSGELRPGIDFQCLISELKLLKSSDKQVFLTLNTVETGFTRKMSQN